MESKYGEFSQKQVSEMKDNMRKSIFFLLLCVDPQTKDEYPYINVEQVFDGLLRKIGGMNELLFYPPELIDILSLLQAALNEYLSPIFDFNVYRKLILDAGATVLKIGENECMI